jgi:hypothetical protein
MSRLRWVLAAALVAATLPLASAAADGDSIDTAFGPLAPEVIFNGAFVTPIETQYVAFDVQAGQTLHFEVANTVQRCTSIYLNGCPMYATLVDPAGNQLGGEGSGAGTGPLSEYWPTEPIDWTFGAAGRYYVAVDSDGDRPTYAIAYRIVPPGAPGAGATTGPGSQTGTGAGAGTGEGSGPGTGGGAKSTLAPIVAISARARQRGSIVRARVRVGRRLTGLTLRLERPGSKRAAPALGTTRIGSVQVGRHTVAVRLEARQRRQLARRGRMSLRLRVVADPASGATQTVLRRVTLVAP